LISFINFLCVTIFVGFFATADEASPGNYGLLDQVQLIQWVRDNIRNFGGNPDLITLFGPGAGAASAGILAISPLTRKYIKRVIASGGSAVSPWAFVESPIVIKNLSIANAAALGCSSSNTYNLVECLKSRSTSEIPGSKVNKDITWLSFAPVLDAYTRDKEFQFLPASPKKMLKEGYIKRDEHFDAYLTGVTRDEGSALIMDDENLERTQYIVSKQAFEDKVEYFQKIFNVTLNPDTFKSAIRFMYSPYNDAENETLIRKGLIDVSIFDQSF